MENWAEEEFLGVNLGDERLTQRLIKLATRFADKPTASIPGACHDWAETQAAYRFFEQSSEKKHGLDWQEILVPHMASTQARMRQHPVVRCLQDTTELDFNGQEIDGLGPLSYEAQRVEISDGCGGQLAVTCVIAKESKPPTGCKAIEWRLLTNRRVTHFDEAAELIDWYRCRWEI